MNADHADLSGELRVLLVEDNELDARVMVKHLSANTETRFEVTRVSDLASAVELLDSTHFDCLLLDLALPDSSGLVSVEVLTARAPTCPIVVLTGLDDPSTAVEAVEHGAQDYLNKQTAEPLTIARSIRYAVARLHSDIALRSATEQLSLLRDRERIARDLHDTVIQQLFATGIGLQSVVGSIANPEAHDRVLSAVDGIDAAIRQLREAIFRLNAMPQGLALAEAIGDLADEKSESLGFRPLVEVGSIPEDLPPDIKHEAIQIITEGLANVAKHAEASATKIIVDVEDGDLVVAVADNGRGMIEGRPPTRPDRLTGRGLLNMAERASELDGRFHIGPGPGGGTRIEWRVSLRSNHGGDRTVG